MALLRNKKGSRAKVGRYYESREFDCACPTCTETLIDTLLVERLDALREHLGCPVRITSGYRCASHQKWLTKHGFETAKLSRHLMGEAADVWTGKHPGKELERQARLAGFSAVGVAKVWIHVDLRDDKPNRRWEYAKR
jgi:uncharacterized protein YcbK (DUF882 family)